MRSLRELMLVAVLAAGCAPEGGVVDTGLDAGDVPDGTDPC
jgi:hypothetical protein